MLISDYSILSIDKVETQDQNYFYNLVNRKESKIYLYNTNFQLAKIIDLSDFGIINKLKDRYQIEIKEKLLCTYNENNGLTVYNLDRSKLFHMDKPICSAYFDERNNYLWVVERNDNRHITLIIIDYNGNTIATLSMKDDLYQSNFIFTSLPEQNKMVIAFAAGQDGTKEYIIALENKKATIYSELSDDMTFLFVCKSYNQGILVDFYEQTIYKCNYPELTEIIGSFQYPEENWSIGEILLLNDDTLILTNAYDNRYYLFDLNTMKITEELILKGYEPYPDSDNILCSDISQIYIKNNKIIFQIEKKINGLKSIKFIIKN
ncbi:hypothetical protein [Fusobacterium sp. PH5-44]|uniref:hypothetical protein n=1 Tax=unclassified Fusobacterium TaxID=2648384 RepID=UPI003D224BF4